MKPDTNEQKKVDEAIKLLQEKENKEYEGFLKRFNEFMDKEGRGIAVDNSVRFPKK